MKSGSCQYRLPWIHTEHGGRFPLRTQIATRIANQNWQQTSPKWPQMVTKVT